MLSLINNVDLAMLSSRMVFLYDGHVVGSPDLIERFERSIAAGENGAMLWVYMVNREGMVYQIERISYTGGRCLAEIAFCDEKGDWQLLNLEGSNFSRGSYQTAEGEAAVGCFVVESHIETCDVWTVTGQSQTQLQQEIWESSTLLFRIK